MTKEQLAALHVLVAEAQAWVGCELGGRTITSLSSPEARLVQALDAVEDCGADEAVVVALNTPNASQ